MSRFLTRSLVCAVLFLMVITTALVREWGSGKNHQAVIN